MCGRYSFAKIREEVESRFHLITDGAKYYQPTYNAAPSQLQAIITNLDPQELTPSHFGLLRKHKKQETITIVNARAESIFEKTSFQELIFSRRCLIPADSYYEWRRQGKSSIPYRIFLPESPLFVFAGIWNIQKQGNTEHHSFSIITTRANSLTRNIHPRMPVIIPEKNEKDWLSDSLKESDVKDLLRSFPSDKMQSIQIEKTVNNVRNNSIDNWKKFEEENMGGLFGEIL